MSHISSSQLIAARLAKIAQEISQPLSPTQLAKIDALDSTEGHHVLGYQLTSRRLHRRVNVECVAVGTVYLEVTVRKEDS